MGDEMLFRILKYFPHRVSSAVLAFGETVAGSVAWISEIRLRANAPMSVTYGERNVFLFEGKTIVCDETEVAETLQRLCEDSVHTYSETIKEGFLSLENGYRVGICGTVGLEHGAIKSVYRVCSLCVRIPHDAHDVAKPLLSYVGGKNIQSALLYAQPNVGKTTLIRDLARLISSGRDAKRASLIDTRNEIYVASWFDGALVDVLRGYPRAKGIEIATRTLSPEVIFCDEIGSGEESSAILSAQNSGVPLIATAHAKDLEMLLKRPNIKILYENHIFRYYIGLSREPMMKNFCFDIFDAEKEVVTCG